MVSQECVFFPSMALIICEQRVRNCLGACLNWFVHVLITVPLLFFWGFFLAGYWNWWKVFFHWAQSWDLRGNAARNGLWCWSCMVWPLISAFGQYSWWVDFEPKDLNLSDVLGVPNLSYGWLNLTNALIPWRKRALQRKLEKKRKHCAFTNEDRHLMTRFYFPCLSAGMTEKNTTQSTIAIAHHYFLGMMLHIRRKRQN